MGDRKAPRKKMTDDGQTNSGSDPSVQVHYLLVVSKKGGSNYLEWRFPKGWNKNFLRNDYRNVMSILLRDSLFKR